MTLVPGAAVYSDLFAVLAVLHLVVLAVYHFQFGSRRRKQGVQASAR